MSLDCEGDGAPCAECGEFDFLPFSCPHCRGVFCAAHTSLHHIPLSAETATTTTVPSQGSEAMVLCVAPPDPSSSPANEDGATEQPALATASDMRCVVCQHFPCVLTPCSLCGEAFCAAHRFHGHESAARRTRVRVGGGQPQSLRSAEGSAGDGAGGSPLAAACAPYTAAHPLSLAPKGYQSRRMDLLALVARLVPSPPPPPIPGAAVAPSPALWRCEEVGVCSLLVATEMSVGQLCDRLCESVQVEEEEEEASMSVRRASLFSIAPCDAAVDAAAGPAESAQRSASRRQRPTLSLVPLPPDVILRKAPIRNACVVLVAAPGAAVSVEETSAVASGLPCALSDLLFATTAGKPKDDRVRALGTRLYLQHQQLLRQHAATAQTAKATTVALKTERTELTPASSATAADAAAATSLESEDARKETTTSPLPPPAQPAPSSSLSPAASTAAASVWPFRRSPPLNSFDFLNSKLRPCGADAIRPPTTPRVVVALFTADTALPLAVRPMCVAVGADWPVVRVVDRLREEVVDQQLGQHRAAAVPLLKTFSLFRLTDAGGPQVQCLFASGAQAAPSSRGATPSAPLKNADVLVLCPAEPPGVVAALEDEVRRLGASTGKEMRALKMDQIKLCNVM